MQGKELLNKSQQDSIKIKKDNKNDRTKDLYAQMKIILQRKLGQRQLKAIKIYYESKTYI